MMALLTLTTLALTLTTLASCSRRVVSDRLEMMRR
jgi:hypothetical protein